MGVNKEDGAGVKIYFIVVMNPKLVMSYFSTLVREFVSHTDLIYNNKIYLFFHTDKPQIELYLPKGTQGRDADRMKKNAADML